MNRSWTKRFRQAEPLASHRLAIVFLVLVASYSPGQGKGGVDQRVAVPEVQKILSGARLSGSLEYWGFCDPAKGWPDFPEPRNVSGREGSALDVLREMFADDPNMRVTQDGNGRIRMAETDIPEDFLEVKIHHLSFPPNYHSGAFAVYYILNTPEVRDFMDHNIGRMVPWEGWGMPGQIFTSGPSVPGELNDVTVAQALDYVLHTFPGFWQYQNCHTPVGRKISVGFHQHIPVDNASLQEGK